MNAVDHPAAKNKVILISGPDSHSWTEATKLVGKAISKEILINYIAPGKPIHLLPDPMVPMLAGMENADSHIDMTGTSKLFGVEPTSLDAFAKRFFGGGA